MLTASCAGGFVEAATTIEVVQEFMQMRARRRTRADSVEIARGYAAALSLPTAGQSEPA